MPHELFNKKSDGWYSYTDSRKIDFPAATPPPSGIFGDPGVGSVYYGIDVGANDNQPSAGAGVAIRETAAGRRSGCLRSYWNSGTSSTNGSITRAQGDLAAGRVPILSYKVDGLGGTNNGWDAFTAGSGDSWFIGLCNSLAAIGKGPILICLHHEPNGNGSAASYLAMCRHAKTLMGSSYPRILLVGGFLADSYYYTNQSGANNLVIADWIQPDSCHLPGLDFYHADASPATTNTSWRNFTTSFASTQSQLSSIYGGLDNMPPLVIGEWGVHTLMDNTSKTTAYMDDFYNWCLQYAYAMAYFDAVGTLWTTLDQQGKTNSKAAFDGETGPPWIRLNKYIAQANLSSSAVIPLGGLT